MPFRARLMNLFRNLLFWRRLDRELHAELIAYLEELAERKTRNGLDPDVARREVIDEMGGIDSVMQQVRREWTRPTARTAVLTAAAMLLCAVTLSAQTNILFDWMDRWLIGPFSPEPRHVGTLTSSPDPRAAGFYVVSAAPVGSMPLSDKWVGTWKGTNHTFQAKDEPGTMTIEVVQGGLKIQREGIDSSGRTIRESYVATVVGNVLHLANRITIINTSISDYKSDNYRSPYGPISNQRFFLYPDGRQIIGWASGVDDQKRHVFRGMEYTKKQP